MIMGDHSRPKLAGRADKDVATAMESLRDAVTQVAQ